MLFILRQLRRSFFQPGKLRTYVAYAIGEILLIVVGILIAVQIGDWNSERKLEQQRQALITNLINDFRINLPRIEEGITISKERNEGLSRFLSAIGSESSQLSETDLRQLARNAFSGFGSGVPNINSYNTAVNTGAINLLKNSALADLFMTYENQVSTYSELVDINRDDVLFGISAKVRGKIGSFTLLAPEKESVFIGGNLPTPELFQLSDSEFRQMISQKEMYSAFENRLIIRSRTYNTQRRIKESIEEILTQLEQL